MWRDFSKALRQLLEIPDAGGSYRPDLHYMRGPGPKWHAKYDGLISKTAPASAAQTQTVHELAERHA